MSTDIELAMVTPESILPVGIEYRGSSEGDIIRIPEPNKTTSCFIWFIYTTLWCVIPFFFIIDGIIQIASGSIGSTIRTCISDGFNLNINIFSIVVGIFDVFVTIIFCCVHTSKGGDRSPGNLRLYIFILVYSFITLLLGWSIYVNFDIECPVFAQTLILIRNISWTLVVGIAIIWRVVIFILYRKW